MSRSMMEVLWLPAALAACSVAQPGGKAGGSEGEPASLETGNIQNQTLRLDGGYDVVCVDASHEIDSAGQIAAGLACVPARTATASFTSMLDTESHGGWSGNGAPTDRADVMLKVLDGATVSAAFYDRAGRFGPPTTAELATLAYDGSFSASAHITTQTGPGCCPALYQRDQVTLTVSGTIAADGTVSLTHCERDEVRSVASPDRFNSSVPGPWTVTDSYWYIAQQPSLPATLSP